MGIEGLKISKSGCSSINPISLVGPDFCRMCCNESSIFEFHGSIPNPDGKPTELAYMASIAQAAFASRTT